MVPPRLRSTAKERSLRMKYLSTLPTRRLANYRVVASLLAVTIITDSLAAQRLLRRHQRAEQKSSLPSKTARAIRIVKNRLPRVAGFSSREPVSRHPEAERTRVHRRAGYHRLQRSRAIASPYLHPPRPSCANSAPRGCADGPLRRTWKKSSVPNTGMRKRSGFTSIQRQRRVAHHLRADSTTDGISWPTTPL
jgi:hypothetical protein